MDKSDIFKRLNTEAPGSISFSIDSDQKLLVSIAPNYVVSNMQEDDAAFEGWILLIMQNKLLRVHSAELEWGDVNEYIQGADAEEQTLLKGYYNIFLYRVMKFQKLFRWFTVGETNKAEIFRFVVQICQRKLYLNYPINESDQSDQPEVNSDLLFLEMKSFLSNKFKEKYSHQMPVGVFVDKIGKESSLFSRSKSAIDLWGIKEDEFWLYQRKYDNARMGAVTELLFNSYILRDLFIEHKIQYPQMRVEDKRMEVSYKNSVRGFKILYDYANPQTRQKITEIKSVILTDRLHPCLSDTHFIKYLNTYLNIYNIYVYTQIHDGASKVL